MLRLDYRFEEKTDERKKKENIFKRFVTSHLIIFKKLKNLSCKIIFLKTPTELVRLKESFEKQREY